MTGSCVKPTALRSAPSSLPSGAREDAREAEDGERLHDLLERLVAVARHDDRIAGAQEVAVGGLPFLDGGDVNGYLLEHSIRAQVHHENLVLVSGRQHAARLDDGFVN